MFRRRGFNQAMVLFLECVEDAGRRAMKEEPLLKFPYKVECGKNRGLPISLGNDEQWTRALKATIEASPWRTLERHAWQPQINAKILDIHARFSNCLTGISVHDNWQIIFLNQAHIEFERSQNDPQADTRVSSEVELHELSLLLEKELKLSDSDDCRSAASSNASSHSRRSRCLLESFGIVVAVEDNFDTGVQKETSCKRSISCPNAGATFLMENNLEDDALDGLEEMRRPLALQYVLSVLNTVDMNPGISFGLLSTTLSCA
ncbi:hypothetical protein PsorP6_015210 [Peronosclerospora sorghi]|uniref:Uncharacterized protein n=1 Tax=Peronosclerospora sorghi TaxID=230839 RepID=A0ACC0VTE4_9STRA|nr:hypothetical protein PsorP6_015210 [Peronosclerospora sorghi]